MTAIVGVMNKHAVALAADSAVTITTDARKNKNKVLNCANKIFNLSKYEPVGVMIYNGASLMGTPWDLIIKMYRQELGEKHFAELGQYINDFLDFLYSKNYFNSASDKREYLTRDLFNEIARLHEQASMNCKIKNSGKVDPKDLLNEIQNLLIDYKNFLSKQGRCKGFESITIDDFKDYLGDKLNVIHKDFEKSIGIKLDETIRLLLDDVLFLSTVQENPLSHDYTGLVFSGYGTEEIYPSLLSIIVRFAYDGKLIVIPNLTTKISNANPSAVCPFAQTDVINTVLAGIADPIDIVVNDAFSYVIKGYNDKIIEQLIKSQVDPNIINDVVKKVPTNIFQQIFSDKINKFIGKEYISKLKETVAYLDIEDLSNMAESLISITSLSRRMKSEEESVGGPVDVAVISKVDGFIWIKRKHYFDKNLNPQFFAKYNR